MEKIGAEPGVISVPVNVLTVLSPSHMELTLDEKFETMKAWISDVRSNPEIGWATLVTPNPPNEKVCSIGVRGMVFLYVF
jgi:hypothetical protein